MKIQNVIQPSTGFVFGMWVGREQHSWKQFKCYQPSSGWLHPVNSTKGGEDHGAGMQWPLCSQALRPRSRAAWPHCLLCSLPRAAVTRLPGDANGKEPTCNAGDTRVRSLGRKDPLEEEIAAHSRILAYEIPWAEEPGGLQSTGSQRVGHGWVHKHGYYLSKAKQNHALRKTLPEFLQENCDLRFQSESKRNLVVVSQLSDFI